MASACGGAMDYQIRPCAASDCPQLLGMIQVWGGWPGETPPPPQEGTPRSLGGTGSVWLSQPPLAPPPPQALAEFEEMPEQVAIGVPGERDLCPTPLTFATSL